MTLRHLLTPLLFCLAVSTVQADEAGALRKKLPTLKGEELLKAYYKLYFISLETDDLDYQLRCVNDFISVCALHADSRLPTRNLRLPTKSCSQRTTNLRRPPSPKSVSRATCVLPVTFRCQWCLAPSPTVPISTSMAL